MSLNYKTFAIVGDGEINEGSFWESSMIASKHKLNNFHIIVDYNKIQSYGKTKEILDLEPLRHKLESFGYKVSEINGHNVSEIYDTFLNAKDQNGPVDRTQRTVASSGGTLRGTSSGAIAAAIRGPMP